MSAATLRLLPAGHQTPFMCDPHENIPRDPYPSNKFIWQTLQNEGFARWTPSGPFAPKEYDAVMASWRECFVPFIRKLTRQPRAAATTGTGPRPVVVYNALSNTYVDWVSFWSASIASVLTSSPSTRFFLLALDDEIEAACNKHSVPSILVPMASPFVSDDKVDERTATCEFRDMWFRVGIAKIVVLAEIVRLKVDAIFAEADVLWRQSPSAFILKQAPTADLLISYEGGFGNVGVIAARGTPAASRFLRCMSHYWLKKRLNLKTVDQLIFNYLLSPRLCHRAYQRLPWAPPIASDLAILVGAKSGGGGGGGRRLLQSGGGHFLPSGGHFKGHHTTVPSRATTRPGRPTGIHRERLGAPPLHHVAGGGGHYLGGGGASDHCRANFTWAFIDGLTSGPAEHFTSGTGVSKLHRIYEKGRGPPQYYQAGMGEKYLTWLPSPAAHKRAQLGAAAAIADLLGRTLVFPNMQLDNLDFQAFRRAGFLAKVPRTIASMRVGAPKLVVTKQQGEAEVVGAASSMASSRLIVLQAPEGFRGYDHPARHKDWRERVEGGIIFCKKLMGGRPCGERMLEWGHNDDGPGNSLHLADNRHYSRPPFCPYRGEFGRAGGAPRPIVPGWGGNASFLCRKSK